MNKVIIIYGPTAVGKSGVGVELAKKINGEIISADSMQIYKHLNIGSAKITNQEMQGIKHHLIDIKEPNEEYSVAEFVSDASDAIEEILAKGKTPIIVGGTGLYIKGLISNYSFGQFAKNDEFRQQLNDYSCDELYNLLKGLSPNIEIDKNNKRRIIRAIEREKYGTKSNKINTNIKHPYILFGLCDNRQLIYERINKRVDKMIQEGLINELKNLLSINKNMESLSMKAIGYKELIPYINGTATLTECTEILKQKTRNYAKRQFTFMNQFPDIIKINYTNTEQTANEMIKIIGEHNE